jgi:xylulokinase
MMLLGIDVGTTGTRAAVLAEDGRLLASSAAGHAPFRSLRNGWAEQDPAEWWRACRQAVSEALALGRIPPADVRAIGLSGQMHGAVLLDDRGEVLRPAIIWCDQRTARECRWLDETIGASRLIALTSNPALTNFTLTKLLWIREHEPDVWSRVRHVLLPKDYIRFRLSGAYATDVADASGTLMLDVGARRWSGEILAKTGIDAAVLPQVFESAAVCAGLSSRGAVSVGLGEATAIVAGAGDQAAGAVGMGITRPGAVSATIGTSGVVFAATDRPVTDPLGRLHTFCHAVRDRWHVMGVTQAAGLSLRWMRDRLGAASYDELTEEAARVPPGADGVMWAPYLMGERTPHRDPDVRAALVGLAANHGRGHIVRAVLEGVAFSLYDTFTIFSELDVPVERIVLGGGGARSALWRQIQADVYARPVETVMVDEGPAFGAAILAGVGVGVWTSVDEACAAIVRRASVTEPRAEAVSIMRDRYEVYRRLYPALREIAHRG